MGGATSLWLTFAGALAATILAFLQRDRDTAIVAGLTVLWTLGAALALGNAGPSFGWGAGVALPALTIVFSRAIARRGAFKGDFRP